MNLTEPITTIRGIGDKTAAFYHKLNIFSVYDLLTHYPREYEEWQDITPINELKVDQIQAIHATVIQTPQTIHIKRNMAITTVHVKDNSGQCELTYFNVPYIKNALQTGKQYILRGQVVMRRNILTMEHPKIISGDEFISHLHTLTPVYSTTKGLTIQNISKSVRSTLEYVSLHDYFPDKLRVKYRLEEYSKSMHDIHFPSDRNSLVAARKRLVFDEFFFFILSVMSLKDMTERAVNDCPMMKIDACNELIHKLPYKLTNAQLKVWSEIEEDMCSAHLMNRLVQGDVGSGKTIVAILAMFMCVMNHKQAAFMAPTEVLAKQHYESICQMAQQYELPFKPILLTGSLTAKEKRIAKEQITSGACNIIIGTQALIQDNVDFYDLKLVITDEQHRFGVKQRETLALKGLSPHILVMSATPIPRTLALILYGDLDISVMDELPADRLPIKNCVVGTDYRQKAYQFITKEVQNGRQAYVICPMVEAGDESGEQPNLENVIDYTDKLRAALPASIRIAYLHGQMKPKEKNHIMEEFAAHNIDVLVSTTVIEVGINVPNSTVMMVENAERFGLAQLHQLRGRVGRGQYQSYCIFISTSDHKNTIERLQVLNKSNDGFYISSEDMRLRGPGDLFGIRQSGQFQFQLGDIYQDASILQDAQRCAAEVYADYIESAKIPSPQYTEIWQHYEENIARSVDFINI